MSTTLTRMVWQQLGASIDMLEQAITTCPPRVWGDRVHQSEFWYIAYHTLFFLDHYLSESADGFTPPSPFTLSEMDPAGILPDRIYTQAELLEYLRHGREKARKRLAGLDESGAVQDSGFPRRGMSVAELLIYTMRHVQHHAAQLYLILRQTTDGAPEWVSKAGVPL